MFALAIGLLLGWIVADIIRGTMNPFTPIVVPALMLIAIWGGITERNV